MHRGEALEALDGSLLGDGNLRMNGRNAQFQMTKSGEEYLGYLCHIREVFRAIEVEICSGYPKTYQEVDKRGNPYILCSLSTLNSPFLTAQFGRWYYQNAYSRKWTKIVPEDLNLTPITLAYWFMDDGTTSWIKGGEVPNRVNLQLCTSGFSYQENTRLQGLLGALGIHIGVCKDGHGSWKLASTSIPAVRLLLNVVEGHIHSCYKYKIKKPYCVGMPNAKSLHKH